MKHETADGITPSFVVIHCLSKIQLGRISFLIERLPLNVHGKMSKVYYSNHSLGLSYMLRVWTIYALFTCLTIRLCNVHESHHTKHRRENYMPKNEDYKNRLGSVRIEPQACVLYLWQERSSYRNVEATSQFQIPLSLTVNCQHQKIIPFCIVTYAFTLLTVSQHFSKQLYHIHLSYILSFQTLTSGIISSDRLFQ